MTDDGAWNLLIAITECAYKDYAYFLRKMKKGKPLTPMEKYLYISAEDYLTGYGLGEYLKKKAMEGSDEIQ